MPNHVSYRRVTDLRGQRYFSLAAVRETVLRISLHAAQQIQDESCRQAGERADAFNSRTGLRWHVFLSWWHLALLACLCKKELVFDHCVRVMRVVLNARKELVSILREEGFV
jgi:hypothetical protein